MDQEITYQMASLEMETMEEFSSEIAEEIYLEIKMALEEAC